MAAPNQAMRREVIGQPQPQLTVDRMQGVPHSPPFARLRTQFSSAVDTDTRIMFAFEGHKTRRKDIL
jgi:hypothetical protein